MTEISEHDAVEAGATWLDQNFAGWDLNIDLVNLDVESLEFCIRGQLDAAGYAVGVALYEHDYASYPVELGFEVEPTPVEGSDTLFTRNYKSITEEWKALIQERQENDND